MLPSTPVTILWTALPYGKTADGDWRVTVFVSPRLMGPGTKLGDPGYWYFHDWPALVRRLRFQVEVLHGGPPFDAEPQGLQDSDSLYWRCLFLHDTPVEPYGLPDFKQRSVWSYSVRDTLREVKNLYQQTAAQAPFALPPLGVLFPLLKELDLLDAVVDFYRRPPRVNPIPDSPRMQFHKLVSALGDHPAALRRLCLAIDLAVSRSPEHRGQLRVLTDWGGIPKPAEAHPWTRFTREWQRFQAQPATGEIDHGYVCLDGTDDQLQNLQATYDLVQVDPDGAAIKLDDLKASLAQLQAQKGQAQWPFDQPDEFGLPALRSAGLALVRHRRQDAQKQRTDRAQLLEGAFQGGNIDVLPLYAEDLLRGYRVDVLDDADPEYLWRSLCERTGEIRLPSTGLNALGVQDEGYVKSASATTIQKEENPKLQKDQVYLHEAVLRWSGWSLAASRPGLGPVSASERLDRPADTPQNAFFPFQARYEARKGSLPRLRFGRHYSLALRTVDLAGNSLPLDPKAALHPTAGVTYQRFEPLPPPALVPRWPFGDQAPAADDSAWGESPENLVIRSLDPDGKASQYMLDHPDQKYHASCQRHVLPPQASADLAETHGALDPWLEKGDEASIREAFQLLQQHEGHLDTHRDVDQHDMPYLPDPAVAGASLWQIRTLESPVTWLWQWPLPEDQRPPAQWYNRFQPRFGSDPIFSVQVQYGQDAGGKPAAWPDVCPFRLALREATEEAPRGTFAWDPDARELAVYLAPAQQLTLRYSSLPQAAVLNPEVLGMWRWLQEIVAQAPFLTSENASAGLLWLLTPCRTLTLVHAVQKPGKPWWGPDEDPASARPALGATYADFTAELSEHTASTARMEVLATWTDDVDDEVNDATPKKVRHDQQLVQFKVPPLDEYERILIGMQGAPQQALKELRHEFGDTKHHDVFYSLRATTRFREYFPPVPDPKNPQQYEIDTHTTTSDPIQSIDVKSSARPLPPKVAYVVPTFGWTEEPIPDGFRRTRVGGGLRIYLDRPWFSSGNEEQLAVVLGPATFPTAEEDKERLVKLVTQYGLDPLWTLKAGIPGPLTADDFFPDPTIVDPVNNGRFADKSLAEWPEQKVGGVRFNPVYRQDWERWYVDLQVKGDKMQTYTPFLRLALVRYQDHSMEGAHLSPVVLTDFVQLVPDRILEYKRPGLHATLTVRGPCPVDPQRTDRPRSRMVITAEEFDPMNHPAGYPLGWVPLDWWGDNGEIEMTATPDSSDPHMVTWSADVIPPHVTKLCRLVVKEYEVYPEPSEEAPTEVVEKERVVYADTIEIQPQ